MTRGMQYFDRTVAQAKNLAVDRLVNGKICLGMRSIYDRGARDLGEVQMTAYKICVKMGFKNIFDRGLPPFRKIQVNLDVPKRIDDRRFAFALDIVCCLT